GHIVQQRGHAGATADRPAAIVAHGTLPNQRVFTATIATIADAVAPAKLESPALLIVGDVVALHATLAWFNTEAGTDLSQSA
ncbi:MAG: uroporphyrin-III C-methyltransferase / precorrin-2 dehydrogenase / sirohydrochlorin ferrochelatase, partial [Gammaproteobacteria bacterium]|nr:uroporphyrin-III C-methyltransferase / precorrin-2 dehydrogenase / sirohydrochlorin ferrochelatase [Gammaproteobacteria bacterium]